MKITTVFRKWPPSWKILSDFFEILGFVPRTVLISVGKRKTDYYHFFHLVARFDVLGFVYSGYSDLEISENNFSSMADSN